VVRAVCYSLALYPNIPLHWSSIWAGSLDHRCVGVAFWLCTKSINYRASAGSVIGEWSIEKVIWPTFTRIFLVLTTFKKQALLFLRCLLPSSDETTNSKKHSIKKGNITREDETEEHHEKFQSSLWRGQVSNCRPPNYVQVSHVARVWWGSSHCSVLHVGESAWCSPRAGALHLMNRWDNWFWDRYDGFWSGDTLKINVQGDVCAQYRLFYMLQPAAQTVYLKLIVKCRICRMCVVKGRAHVFVFLSFSFFLGLTSF
jgi:hypothetical protein